MSLNYSMVAIIDDEPDALTYLTLLLAEIPGFNVSFSEKNPIVALKKIREYKPDILILDIKMPNLSGIALAELVIELDLQVIFVSAFDISAREAFGVNAIDYIYKPASKGRLSKALHKAKNASIFSPSGVKSNRYPTESEFLHISLGNNSLNQIPMKSIKFIQGGSDYSQIITIGNKKYLDPNTLQDLEQKLLPQNILRIHKSFMVNMNMAEKITPNYIKLDTGEEIPVGRTYKTNLLARYTDLKQP